MILLDSSVLIELFRKKNKEQTLFFNLLQDHDQLAISVITHYEIGIGNQPGHLEYWKKLCNNLTIIPFDESCTETAIKIYRSLIKINKKIDLADILIGATALAYDLPIATLNIKDFERIQGLHIVK
ncbi:MAG: type II toxin-antitoxin system VapC family toxin [Crocinitomicaceae bacterium]|nr:type II toxin-antitoxin system VapC family toxin [Crocinitomicaceae bacterium]MBK8925339.1 type II toxin-antitoxin system VapC family toxin [Crocinitomicaceae bacterium]